MKMHALKSLAYTAIAAAATIASAPSADAQVVNVRTDRIVSGLNYPVFVTHAPGDSTRLFIVQKGGAIRIFDRTTNTLLATPFLSVAVTGGTSVSDERGLLETTLVVVMGEFGRTPTINPAGGRDHWGSVFSVALAGAGVPGGAVIGASDARGALPADRPVRPPDLAATIFHLLGIPPEREIRDPLDRPLSLVSGGAAIAEIVGG